MTRGRRGNPGCGLASHLGGHSCPFRGAQQQAPGAEGTVRRRRHFAGEGGVGHGLGPRACLSCGSFSSLILTSSHQARRRPRTGQRQAGGPARPGYFRRRRGLREVQELSYKLGWFRQNYISTGE